MSKQQNFIDKANRIHNNQYDYSMVEYSTIEKKVTIICHEHGEFEQSPRVHTISKHGCPECGKAKAADRSRSTRLTTEEFIKRASEIHNGEYMYNKTMYVRGRDKVTITCPIHGDFEQTPENHMNRKQGCTICGRIKSSGIGGYTETLFENYPERKSTPAIFYVLHMTCETDDFIKVGITTRSIKQRYARTHCGDKYINKNVLVEKPMSLYEAFLLEQSILKSLKRYQYFPNHLKDGQTECLQNKPEVVVKIMEYIL